MPAWKPEINNTVKNISSLPMLHEILRENGVLPTYLVNRPVLENKESLSIIIDISKDIHSEIGLHLHSWNTEPITEEEKKNKPTVLNNLSQSLQEQKIQWMHNYFLGKMGFPAKSYRAGRYGASQYGASVLASLGYEVDSSVVPRHSFSEYGGPDYRLYNCEPFWIGGMKGKEILEVPISADLISPYGDFPKRMYSLIPKWSGGRGVFHRLNIARLLWLRPTTYSYGEMRQLVDYIRLNMMFPVFNIMFHSSEMYPGASPYARTILEVHSILERLKSILKYLINDIGAIPFTLSGLSIYFKDNYLGKNVLYRSLPS